MTKLVSGKLGKTLLRQVLKAPKRLPGRERVIQRFTDQEHLRIVRMLAEFQSADIVQKTILRETGKRVTTKGINALLASKKWQPLLEHYRRMFCQAVQSSAIAHKRVRLDRMEERYAKVNAEPKLPPLARERMLLAILQAARAEVDEKRTHFGDTYITQIQQFSDSEIRKQIDRYDADIKALESRPGPGRKRNSAGLEQGLISLGQGSGGFGGRLGPKRKSSVDAEVVTGEEADAGS